MAFIKTDETKRITAASFTHHCGDGEIETEIPAEIFDNIHDYLYVNNEFVYDPLPEPEVDGQPTQLDRVEAQITYTAMMTDTLLEV